MFRHLFIPSCIALLPWLGCAASYPDVMFPSVNLSSHFQPDSCQSIALYVHPSKEPAKDLLFGNLIHLDLLSRGYLVTRINNSLTEGQLKTLQRCTTAEALRDSLRFLPAVVSNDALVVSNLTIKGFAQRLSPIRLLPAIQATGKIYVCALPEANTIVAHTFVDTSRVIRYDYPFISIGAPRHVLARGLNTILSDFPIRAGVKLGDAKIRIPVTIYADNSYRERFPDDWRERIVRRMLFVNDIYTPQTGILFEVRQIKTWNAWFSDDIDQAMARLNAAVELGPWINLGISYNNMLATQILQGSYVGLGSFATASGIMTVIPTLPGLGPWNSLDDATVIAHEIGHVLGLPHIRDVNSIMYPTSSTMSVRFDSVSLRMLRTFSRDFLSLTPQDRCLRRLNSIHQWYRSGKAPRIQYVAVMLNDLNNYWKLSRSIGLSDTTSHIDTSECRATLSTITTDPVLTNAVLGQVHASHKRWNAADSCFDRALKLSPLFAEVYELKLQLYLKQDDWIKARKMMRRLEELDPWWKYD